MERGYLLERGGVKCFGGRSLTIQSISTQVATEAEESKDNLIHDFVSLMNVTFKPVTFRYTIKG